MSTPRPYGGLILDLDGCVWIGAQATPGAPEAIDEWRRRGGRVVFATNEPRHSPEAQVQRLWSLGIRAAADEVVTSGSVVQAHLAETHAGADAFVIGADALIRHVVAAGLRLTNNTSPARAESADVVVIGGHDQLSYAELRIATRAVLGGAVLVATGRDRLVPHPDGPVLGTGSILAAVEYATGIEAIVVGKPDRRMFDIARERLGDGRPLVIGDRLDSDVAGAHAAGLDAGLVLSGTSDSDTLTAWAGVHPVLVAPTLAEMLAELPDPR